MPLSPTPDTPAQRLAVTLGVVLHQPELLEVALVHRSWAFEEQERQTNERLEFLGDAVLGLVVTEELFHRHPEEPEGQLAKLRAAVVRTESLAAIAGAVRLGDALKLGRGETASGGATKASILADGLEAVFGAIYVDQGYAIAREVILRLFAQRLEEVSDGGASLDFKTSLQELTAARFATVPRYRVSDEGPDHAKTFTASVAIDGTNFGTGTGSSKKQAEQRAAEQAWRALQDPDGQPERPAVGPSRSAQ